MTSEVQNTSKKTLWETLSPHSNRDLIIKKVALCVITAINLGGIATLLSFVCLNYPIPTTALLVSPVIVGVIGALTFLKVPTLGVSRVNYTEFTNPAVMFARIVTIILLGPVVYTLRALDWTHYGDPFVANRITNDFKNDDLETLLLKYGPSISNLKRYGYFSKEEGKELKKIYREALPHFKEKQFFQEEQVSAEKIKNIQDTIDGYKTRWENLKTKITPTLPEPELPKIDFTSRSARIKVWVRKNLNIYSFS